MRRLLLTMCLTNWGTEHDAMNRNLQCCTSKLISRRKTYTVQESNRSSHSAVDDVSLSNASV